MSPKGVWPRDRDRRRKRPQPYPPLTAPNDQRAYLTFRTYDPDRGMNMVVKGQGIRLEYFQPEEVIALLSEIAPPAPVRRVSVSVAYRRGRRYVHAKTLTFEGLTLEELRAEVVRRLSEAAKHDAPVIDGLGLG